MVTNKYEAAMVFSVKNGDDAVKALTEKFNSLITENATVENVDDWGKRRLAYPINDLSEGYYVLVNFNAKTDFPAELERVFGITEGIMRYMVTRVEA